MSKLPSFQFYPGDWLRDDVSGCSLEAQGLWLRMMMIMHDAQIYGQLVLNNEPMSSEFVAKKVGISPKKYANLLKELDYAGVINRKENGVIYSGRMERDEAVRQQNRARQEKHRAGDKAEDNEMVTSEATPEITDVSRKCHASLHSSSSSSSKNKTHKSETGVCEPASRQEEEETGTDVEYSDFHHSLTDWYEDALDADSLPPGSVADRDVRYLFANHFTLAEISEYYEAAKHDQWRKGPVTISAIAKGIAHWRSGQTTTAAPERPDFSNCPLGCDPDTGLIYVSDNGHSGMKRCTHKPEQENQQNAEIRS